MPIDFLGEMEGALRLIDPAYCRLSSLVYHEDAPAKLDEVKFLERPIAYEFYHQFRLRMQAWPDDSGLTFQPEVDKRYQGILNAQNVPDFLLHRRDVHAANVAVIEVKRAAAGIGEARDDQKKLRGFFGHPLEYTFAIQIIVGSRVDTGNVCQALASSRQLPEREIILSLDLEGRRVARL